MVKMDLGNFSAKYYVEGDKVFQENMGQGKDDVLARLIVELRRRGYRVTAQRLAIAKIVLENIKKHPSFMQIVEIVRSQMPSISPSTIYNNLQLLEELGFIKSFDVAGETHYDSAHNHVNIACVDTDKIYDVDGEEVYEVLSKVAKLDKKKIIQVVVYANCKD
jgi:Fur family peroxide stress response transcriptional regulator